jgi:hypothetical protein
MWRRLSLRTAILELALPSLCSIASQRLLELTEAQHGGGGGGATVTLELDRAQERTKASEREADGGGGVDATRMTEGRRIDLLNGTRLERTQLLAEDNRLAPVTLPLAACRSVVFVFAFAFPWPL